MPDCGALRHFALQFGKDISIPACSFQYFVRGQFSMSKLGLQVANLGLDPGKSTLCLGARCRLYRELCFDLLQPAEVGFDGRGAPHNCDRDIAVLHETAAMTPESCAVGWATVLFRLF